ncbi:hypothetical protein [Mesorhizobium sp. M0030]|uniref:hypothetical protein n=1 Tax=Mesorhizobium sp. M0030 TaxID=2956851 RepID=UPI003336CFD1
MMRKPAFQLPTRVHLPASVALLDHMSVLILMGNPSRQLLAYYRRHRNFPRAYRRDGTSWTVTDSLERWCIDNGITVERVNHERR